MHLWCAKNSRASDLARNRTSVVSSRGERVDEAGVLVHIKYVLPSMGKMADAQGCGICFHELMEIYVDERRESS